MITSKQKGIALISVFWVLIILSIMALTVLSIGKTESELSANSRNYAQGILSAEAAINHTIVELSSRQAVQKIRNGVAKLTYKYLGKNIEIEVVPEEGKIDLNTSDPIMISALLAYFGVPENSARNFENEIRQTRNQAGTRPFYKVDDIKQMSLFPVEIFPCIEPYITVYSQRNGIDLNLASDDMNNFVKWADTKRWGGQNWLNTSGAATSGLVSSRNDDNQKIRSYSGRAFTIVSYVPLNSDVKVSKKAIVRITGNLREPVWTYLWEANYANEEYKCNHL